jgi:type IV pilus assembly protein PilE
MPHNKRYSGFSLVELLILLAIIALLASIAYPSYISHITKAKRNSAVIALIDLASRLEIYYSEHYSYSGATIDNLNINFYRLEIINADAISYLLKATPIGTQAKYDKYCGSLILDNLGNKTISGTGVINNCW